MIRSLQHLLSRPAQRKRCTRDTRTRSVLPNVECLEARCLLSASPAVGGHAVELRAVDAVDLGDNIIVVQPFQPFASDPFGADSLRLPPGTHVDHIDASPRGSHDSAASDGMVDIGEPYQSEPADIFTNRDPSHEDRDVAQMLASLRYLPNAPHAEAITSLFSDYADEASEGRPMRMRAQTAAEPRPGTTDYLAPSTASDMPQREMLPPVEARRSDDALQQGGMVALTRDVVIDPSASSRPEPSGEVPSLLRVPVRMDGAYGRFQAFEISTDEASEEPPSTRPTQASPAREAHAPLPDAAGSAAWSQAKLAPQQALPTAASLARIHPHAISQTTGSWPAIDPSLPHGNAESRESSNAAAAVPPARVPSDEEAKSHSLVKATAAAAALAIGSRIAQPTTANLPLSREDKAIRSPEPC